MNIIICPGIHEPELTESFVSGWLDRRLEIFMASTPVNIFIYPGRDCLTLSAVNIVEFLGDRLKQRQKSPVMFISFSAGVVGAIVAASWWQHLGGNIKAFVAIDGWGVPLYGDFPIHRMSHNYFTHWSSSLLGSGQDNFYAEPAVDHLSMWRSPQSIQGWRLKSNQAPSCLSAAEFLHLLLKHYEEK
ncbi:hypothetical protein [Fortiea contorta]|uniref:hypothetical protein n=1 Tax=Fortiea contorta TaxID=1892405 RepID=UPI000345CF52|nr:hypothetical protein [Fortiea contorta]